MKLSIENRKNILSITLLLMLITYIFTANKPHSMPTLAEGEHEVMLSEQMLLITEIFNAFGNKVDGTCDSSVKSELIATVMQHSWLYGLTFLKNNQPYCSSQDSAHLEQYSAGDNIDSVFNYIIIDEHFTIQVEMKYLVSQDSKYHYLLAFVVMPGDESGLLHHYIDTHQVNGAGNFFGPYIAIQIGGGSRHAAFSASSTVGLVIASMVLGIFFFMYGGQRHISYAIKTHLLKWAIIHHELRPYMQPVVSSTDGRVIGGEILLRWLHPKKGIVYPADFIGIAERSGLIVTITRQLFVRVKKELLEVAPYLPAGFKVGFNISATHLGDQRLVQDCVDFIGSFKLGCIVMVLEITEREAIVYSDVVHGNINGLRRAGIRLAIDDYGTGNSTLRNIQKIPFDYIKIDKSFIDLVVSDKVSMHILKNIMDLAASVNAKTVAEGVETAEQANLLALSGVHFQQGWLWGKAMPIAEMISLTRSDS